MKLIQVSLPVLDLDRASTFYRRLLEAEPVAQFDPPGLLFFDLDGCRLLLDRAGEALGGPTSGVIYLNLPNLRDKIEELRAGGIEIATEPHVIFRHEDAALGPAGTDEWHAFVRDTEGNLVGLVDFVPQSS